MATIPLPLVSTGTGGGGCGSCAQPPSPTGIPEPSQHPDSLLSSEVFVLPVDDGRYIAYAPLRRAAFVTNAAGVNALADLQDGVEVDDEPLLDLLAELEMIDGGPELPPDDLVTGPAVPTSVTLFLTTACNLRCRYCYASAGDAPASSMSLETARRGIDHVLDTAAAHGLDTIPVHFHGGGEPTVNWSVLTGALDHAERRGRELGIATPASLVTNGVLRDAQVTWMIDRLRSATVSFDGLPAVQDANRPRADGRGSSASVLRTLERLDAAGFRYAVRMTVTAETLADLPASVEFVCSRFGPRRVQVEPAFALGRGADAESTEAEAFVAAYREAARRAERHGGELGYSAARLGLLTNHFCGVTRDTFALSPDGNASACYEVFDERLPDAGSYFWARQDADGGYTVDQPALDGLRAHAGGHHAFCRGCFAKWSCAGDCLHLARTENGEFRGSDRCHVTRELTKDQILRAIEDAGGVAWCDGPDDLPEERW